MTGVNKLAKLTSVENAMRTLFNICGPVERTVTIDLEGADNRVLSKDILAPGDFPAFNQCLVDGFAVRAADTEGCGGNSGRLLKPVRDGEPTEGCCMQVYTGGALPAWADAVVRLEDTVAGKDGITILAEVRPGDGIMPRGKVIKKGDVVYKKGAQIKPTDAGTLCRLGVTSIEVFDRPRVLVIPTGDELIEKSMAQGDGTYYDGDSMMSYLLIKRCGGEPTIHCQVPDDLKALEAALMEGLGYDLVVTSGGTSIGPKDLLDKALSSVGTVLIHGIGIKPGRPMGIGYVEGDGRRTPVLFLPGVMEAFAVTTLTFVLPEVRMLAHYPEPHLFRKKVVLTRGVRSFPGGRHLTKVSIDGDRATPVNIVGERYTDSDYAYVVVPESLSVYREGEEVDSVYLE